MVQHLNPVQHLSPEQRAALGRAARKETPRSAHAAWDPPADRPSPVALLELQAKTRVPELVPIRYGRMMATPFTFYRGAALVMAWDLSTTPVSGLRAQLCGDAHLTNFGLFASPDRRLLFDLNDFDETLPGPWEWWDVKRLVASIVVAGRSVGLSRRQRERAALATAAGYRSAMRRFARMRNLDVYYARLDADTLRTEVAGAPPPSSAGGSRPHWPRRARATVSKVCASSRARSMASRTSSVTRR